MSEEEKKREEQERNFQEKYAVLERSHDDRYHEYETTIHQLNETLKEVNIQVENQVKNLYV